MQGEASAKAAGAKILDLGGLPDVDIKTDALHNQALF